MNEWMNDNWSCYQWIERKEREREHD
jgi:hypothetical protein